MTTAVRKPTHNQVANILLDNILHQLPVLGDFPIVTATTFAIKHNDFNVTVDWALGDRLRSGHLVFSKATGLPVFQSIGLTMECTFNPGDDTTRSAVVAISMDKQRDWTIDIGMGQLQISNDQTVVWADAKTTTISKADVVKLTAAIGNVAERMISRYKNVVRM